MLVEGPGFVTSLGLMSRRRLTSEDQLPSDGVDARHHPFEVFSL
jgi:hypothetical protein